MAGWRDRAASVSQWLAHPLAAVADARPRRQGDLRRNLPNHRIDLGPSDWGTWWEWDGRLTSMLILFFSPRRTSLLAAG
jgi:heme exporter protein C